jgi:hypothetical protein
MPVVAAPLSSPMVLSRRDSSELAQKTRQPIQYISLLSPSMMSGMSGYKHVTMLNKTVGVVTGLDGPAVIAAVSSGLKEYSRPQNQDNDHQTGRHRPYDKCAVRVSYGQ